MSIKKNAGSIAVFILLFVISFIFIIPFIWTMLTSLKPDEEIYSSVLTFLPVNPYLGHYTGIFTKLGNFFKYFSNSVVVSFWSVLFNVLFAATLGYSFSKFQYWGRDLFLGFARIDGAGQWQTFSRVMLPIVKPGIATVIIMTFISVWGEFTYARTLCTTAKSQTLAVGITFLRDEAASWQYGTLTATIILSLIPVLAIFLSMQKYFIKGIMAGAVKG